MQKKILTAILLLAAVCLNAQDIEQNIKTLNGKTQTYTATFTEKTVMPKMNKQTVKQGTIRFVSPDALLMDYTDPQGDYTLIKDGKFIVSRKGQVQNMTMTPKSQMYIFRETLLGSMTGDLKRVAEQNEADIDCKQEAGKYVCILTKQKAKTTGINRLELEYDTKTGALVSLNLIQANGNYTIYETTGIQLNQKIDSSVWNK